MRWMELPKNEMFYLTNCHKCGLMTSKIPQCPICMTFNLKKYTKTNRVRMMNKLKEVTGDMIKDE